MRAFAAFLIASLCCGYAVAQITDPTQRKDWYYLQTLSKQLEEFRQCPPSPDDKIEWDKYWWKVDKKTAELAVEIELYAKNYVDRRGIYESPDTFKYRVWDTTLSVGKREARKLDLPQCLAARMPQ